MMRGNFTILCHNAFWFQGAPFPSDSPGEPVAEILAELLELYRRISPDVVCLQEIQDQQTFARLAEALRLGGSYCPGGHYPQYGGAMFWKTGRQLADSQTHGLRTQRLWQVAEVGPAHSLPLTVCNIHLTSNRHLGEAMAACARIDDLRQPLEWSEPPQVMVGDFNEGSRGSVSAYLYQHGYTDAAFLTGNTTESTGVGKARSDQIWVHESVVERVCEFTIVGWDTLRTDHPGKEYLSDHLPLYLTIK
ncbi:MAG: endonuclease/exonuclease/phosphatase family protein [Candidatus Hydrogenedentes bacterium]|nr:endonuclease/exonuclease/phosphatase family protein [Candidatus Hydrogenedentota bacterium]